MLKWIRATFAAGIFLAAYFCYATFVVPWIEPPPTYAEDEDIGAVTSSKPAIDTQALFPPDAWQNSSRCKTIETSRGVLLFEEFNRDVEGAITLNPVTLVFHNRNEGADELDQQSDDSSMIILEAPDGAELRSDTGLNVARMQFGKIVGGQLKGIVTIRSPHTVAPEKQLWLQTRDVRIDGSRIWTPHQVRFQYGKSRGSGSNLVITTSDAKKEQDENEDQAFGKIESLELVQLEELIVAVKASDGIPFAPDAEPAATPVAGPEPPTVPLRITCGGSLFYDFEHMTAKLDDGVRVVRQNPLAEHDTLECSVLTLRFEQESKLSAGDAGKSEDNLDGDAQDEGGNWNLIGMRAVGGKETPLVLRAPSQEAVVLGQSLEFDARSRRLVLKQPTGKAELHYRDFHVVCPQVDYIVPLDSRRLGKLWAMGPGRVDGVMKGETQAKPFGANWGRLLQIEPRETHHVLSLYERVRLEMDRGKAGTFDASRIHLYLEEIPVPGAAGRPRYELTPLRMRALDGVAFDSPELSGNTPELNVYFETPQSTPLADAGDSDSAGSLPLGLEAPAAADDEPKLEEQRKFHVDGGKMELRVLAPTKGPMTLDDVTVAGAVVIKQTRLALKDKGPLSMTGDVLRISSVSRDRNRLTMRGRPAEVSMGPLNVKGGEIVFDQQANEITIDGAGSMTFPSSKKQPNATTTIAWRRGMDFDGRLANFNGQVVVDGTRFDKRGRRYNYHAEAAVATAKLNQHVNFKVRKTPKDVELAHVALDGGVFFENQSSSPDGKLLSHEKMQTNNFAIDLGDGDFFVEGPGWGSTARFLKQRFNRPPGSDKEAAMVRSQQPRLTYLHVTFEDGVRGNMFAKQTQFNTGVIAVYGPIKTWGEVLDPKQRGGLGVRGVELRCNQLQVLDISTNDDPIMELIATGNTIVENEMYGATAQRLSFTESKNLIVLDGDSTYDAKLKVYGPNPKSAVAKRIKFWTDTYDFDVDRVQSIQFGSFGRPARSTPKPLRTGRLR